MTRREEIEQQAEMFRQPYKGSGNYSTSIDIKNAFQEGAEWANKTMIEKAYKWLEEYGDDFGVPESESGRVYVDDLVREFRNAMEE